ncbi:alpha-amylase family glycosyl hydrolase [Carboxylicivirga caseinilyticus]|uniref:alpha-amylase family glycosyl hydrolase n=1 Tax=Carboxylicivirga caseinilyticus TaxID=3417572 RepID=UPI003D328337|nr:T9SS type A sorting domain-containing protein [Marinilabiliaceae bacterium A049]
MNRIYFLGILIWLAQVVSAQVVTSNPAIPVESDQVIITFYADRGTAGLEGYTGDIYAHTGVITDKSTSDTDWKYAKADWGVNIADCKLTQIGSNQYTLTISPTIRQFYGVPDGEKILKMAFVFRSADSSLEGKDTGGGDIFVSVSDAELGVAIESPVDKSLVPVGDDVVVSVNSILSEQLTLFINDVEITSTAGTSISYTISGVSEEQYHIRAVATSGANSVEDNVTFYTRDTPINEARPAGLRRGVNRIDDNSVTVLLYAPYKEYVYLMGDFNDWTPMNDYLMKKDGDYFWLTLTGLTSGEEYAYQYWMDDDLKIADPYTNKVLDPWNDGYIGSDIYPNLKAYPEGKTSGIVSVFSTSADDFQWDATGFNAPDRQSLVVYELLIRDFTANQDIKTVTDTLSYLKRLGVNAIELMPFNEFEGNDSWGYNPSFYFATDKAYGTVNDYKAFINECHKNGIAVIMDMVLNHSFGQSPFVQMYFDGDKPTAQNPWYNVEHNMKNPDAQWGYDFNHESLETQALVDSICSFWMSEYQIDGFRFDFTKGFTNTVTPATGDNSWASNRDDSRIAILKRMSNEIWKRKSDAYVIFEHLSNNDEETILANHGIMLWGNANHDYNEATIGYDSDLSWTSYENRGWNEPQVVNYMESHDEERLMYKNLLYGASEGDYKVANKTTALKRVEAAAVIFFSTPGPKMVWQFGELGFDLSINRCTDGSVSNDCRLAQKPPVWQYQDDEDRARLFNVFKRMIDMKTGEEVFNTSDFTMDVSGSVKKISLNLSGSDVRVVSNFALTAQTTSINFSSTGWWYNVILGDSINVTNTDVQLTFQPGEYVVYSQKKLTGFDTNTSIDDDVNASSKINCYPNPFTESVQIETNMTGEKLLEIYSISGACIKKIPFQEDKMRINLSELSIGQYIIRITNGSEVIHSKVFKY